MSKQINMKALPKLGHWLDREDLSVWDFLAEEGGAELAIAFSALFWPGFVEVKGCVFLEEKFERANFEEWWNKFGGDHAQVEAMINHVHLWDLFDPESEGVPEEEFEQFAFVLASAWECALKNQFSDRDFRIRVSTDSVDYGPTISFTSIRHSQEARNDR